MRATVLAAIAGAMLTAGPALAFEFKGIPLGGTMASFKAAHPAFSCMVEVPCDTLSVGIYDEGARAALSYAGVAADSISARFIDSKLAIVTIRFKPGGYRQIVEALAEKYGPPTIERSELQNRMGAKFDQEVATWESSAGRLEVKRFGMTLEMGVLSMASKAWDEWKAGVDRQRSKAAAKEL